MKVRVIDRAEMERIHGKSYGPLIFRTVEIADTCPVCGGSRGKRYEHRFCEDGEYYIVDRWDNPCGHSDMYEDVIKEVEKTA